MQSRRFMIPSAAPCVAAIALAWLAPAAQALELGPVRVLSGLGQPLSVQVPVRWASDEVPRRDCLKASVEAGERSLPASELSQSWVVEPSQGAHKTRSAKAHEPSSGWVWLRSRGDIAEPVLRLSLGCPAQQLTVFLDPLPPAVLVMPAAGPVTALEELPRLTPSPVAKPPLRALKVRAERPTGPVLRLDDAGLPPLSLPDAQLPGLRFRFDSDLASMGSAQQKGPSLREPMVRAERKSSLLMAIDVGRAMSAAELLASDAGLGDDSAPARLLRAQQQFEALQAEQRAMRLEMEKLQAQLAQSHQASARRWRLLALLALGMAVLGAGLFFMMKRKRRLPLDEA